MNFIIHIKSYSKKYLNIDLILDKTQNQKPGILWIEGLL